MNWKRQDAGGGSFSAPGRPHSPTEVPAITVTVIGLGLIGGSMAIDLRRSGFAGTLIGVDANPLHASTAVKLGLVDRTEPLEAAVGEADLVITAVPVDAAVKLVPQVLDAVQGQVVTDTGSTKTSIMRAIKDHPRRARFVGSHPMAGTEHSGPWAALANLFAGKAAIICDADASDPDAVELVERMYDALNMRLVHMDSDRHDVHVAYVSHISHVTSFALALTVLEKEKDEARIFDLASGGFSSTARLAKSSADMWLPIFRHNRENVLNVLGAYIRNLEGFREALLNDNATDLETLIRNANRIRRVLEA